MAQSSIVVGIGHLRKQGRWYHFRWTCPETGQRKTEALKTKNQRVAMEKAVTLSGDIESGETRDRLTRRKNRARSFAEVSKEYAENMATRWEPTTVKANRSVRTVLDKEFGALSIGEIATRDIDAYLQRRREKDQISASTANKLLAYLSGMFKKAITWGYLNGNPMAGIKSLKIAQSLPDALTDDQLERLLSELKGLPYDVVLTAAETGLRTSEMRRLVWADVDWTDGDNGSVKVKKSKTGTFRVVYLTERIQAHLIEMKERAKDADVIPLVPLDQLPIFPSKIDPTRPFSEFAKTLSKAGEKAGIGHVHLHQMRHTWATRLRDRAVPLDRIMELGGWKTFAMVTRYAKARPTQLQSAIATLNG